MDAKEKFEQEKNTLQSQGFEPMMLHVEGWNTAGSSIPAIPMSQLWDVGSDMQAGHFSMQESVLTDPVPGCGTDRLAAVCWGPGNDMPQRIEHLVNALPYTAQGINYLHDIILGLGPQLQWHTSFFNPSTGRVEEITLPYEHAATYLRGRIASLSATVPAAAPSVTSSASSPSATVPAASPAATPSAGVPTPSAAISSEIADLQRSLNDYLHVKPSIDAFLADNDVLDWLDRLVTDYVRLGICFPTLLLSLGRYRDDNGNIIPWEPTIKRLDSIPDVVARLEQRDSKLRINYVYHAEKWRHNNDTSVNLNDAVAYPTLWPKNFMPKYRKMVLDARTVVPKLRPTQFVAPVSFCDNTNGYYPWMPWWSIFTSKAYAMAASYMSDKAVARNNSNMWGKMVFINNEYLRALYSERGADTAEEKQTIRKMVWDNINKFLKDKSNNQKTICLDSVMSPDGKSLMDAIKVVDVPGLSESTDMKEALEEITSVIFFGMGIHPALVGAIPGKTTSNSGTYQRELTLLKQNQLSPVQHKFLRLLNLISDINGWNTSSDGSYTGNFRWVIRQQVLTTLDRNPEGRIEQNVH